MSFTIYPAIDLRGGKVVRLKEGDPARMTAYSNEPAETARRWLDAGAKWLHVVNLDGAFEENDDSNRLAIGSILKLGAQVQLGGGIRSLAAMEQALAMGVSRVVIGTLAVQQPDVIKEAVSRFGVEQVAVGIDAREGLVRVRGWKEDSGIPAIHLARQMHDLGLRTVIFTDVSRDGVGSGLNIPATSELAKASGLDVIASGGVHTLDDVSAARKANLAGLIIGRALYDGTIDLMRALESTSSRSTPVGPDVE